MNLSQYGFSPELLPKNPQGLPARITAVHRGRFALISEAGEGYGKLKSAEYDSGREEYPTVGDFVLIHPVPGGDSQIIRTLPRKSFFSRRDPDRGRGEQIIAANFDLVVLLQSLNQDFNIRRLERYLTLAWQSGASPVVVLTKSDLTSDPNTYLLQAQTIALGCPVLAVSAKTGKGLDDLKKFFVRG